MPPSLATDGHKESFFSPQFLQLLQVVALELAMAYIDTQYLKVPRATPECPPSLSDSVSSFTGSTEYHPEARLYLRNGLENVAPVLSPGKWSATNKLVAQQAPTEVLRPHQPLPKRRPLLLEPRAELLFYISL